MGHEIGIQVTKKPQFAPNFESQKLMEAQSRLSKN